MTKTAMIDDSILADAKNAEKDFEEAVVQLNKDNKSQTLKGVGILVLFLVACGGFITGVLWAADRINTDIETSSVAPGDK